MANKKSSAGMVGGIVFLLFMFVMIWVIFKAVSGVFWILSIVAPVLLIFALFMNHTVVTDYIRWLFKLLKEDTGKGLLYTAGTVLGYPLVAAFLAMKAYTKRTLGTKRKPIEKEEEYIKYEEVEESEDFLELEELDEVKQKPSGDSRQSSDNSYDDLFS